MLANIWNIVLSWFQDSRDRSRILREYNAAAAEAFLCGEVPTLLKARITKGEKSYRHRFSNWFHSGFRIQACTGKALSKKELQEIGDVILSEDVLVRHLVVLGFDTLEICGDVGAYGCRWQLKDHMQLS